MHRGSAAGEFPAALPGPITYRRLELETAVRLATLFFAAALAVSPAMAELPVRVMIVGAFHMSNPGKDIHSTKVDDMLAPQRQKEIAAVTDALANFKPTMVAIEWPADITATRYESYLKGTLAPSPNESVQLGFRLAKTAGLASVQGIDVLGDFPYDAVEAYAKAHGQSAILDTENADMQAMVDKTSAILAHSSVGATLRYLNEPARIAGDNAFYRAMLAIGGGDEQPGVDLLTAWYARNFHICANLVQRAKPGDRVVVFYGAGHAFLLRQCVAEMPGYKLIEANDYLPK